MPKEMIYTGTFNTVVGWSKGTVQVAVEIPEPRQDGQPATLLDLVGIGDTASARGLYATCNRDQLNTLIRTLRRARDSAFGRDE